MSNVISKSPENIEEKDKREERRYRGYLITINEKAEVFNTLEDVLNTSIGNKDIYAYILHDKDIDINGEIKKQHYHLFLKFQNPRFFKSIRLLFKGAHIEPCISIDASINYLIHNGKPDKYQYDQREIITNNEQYIKSRLSINQYEPFIEDKLPFYVICQGVTNYLIACLRFGASNLPYDTARKIKEINESYYKLNEEEKNDLNIFLNKKYNEDLPF